MTHIVAGVADVYVIRRVDDAWQALVLERGEGTRCTGAWEVVHGRIHWGERPEDGAIRELREETGLAAERLYNVTVQPFYLHDISTVQLAVVFAAIVSPTATVVLGDEHARYEWLAIDAAIERVAWPREREAFGHIAHLLRSGDAGAVEDVLRVR